MEIIFYMYGRVFGIGEFKYANEFFREQMVLSWQPNVGKNKPKMQSVRSQLRTLTRG